MKKRSVLVAVILVLVLACACAFSACDVELRGESAYQIAVRNGFTGSETEWLASLVGPQGEQGEQGEKGATGATGAGGGDSAYQIAVRLGYEGTEVEWLASLVGSDGEDGEDGADGADVTIESVYNAAVEAGYSGTFLEFLGEYLSFSAQKGGEYAVAKALLSSVSVYCFINAQASSYASGGSGFILQIDKAAGDAYIVTNYHVVYNASYGTTNNICPAIRVMLYGSEYKDYMIDATYVGGSMTYDVAVIKVSGSEILKNSNAESAVIANSNDVHVGEKVYAIGNSAGGGISLTEGVVSVDSEYIEMMGADDVTKVKFRTTRIDAAINSGNSGGGVFNGDGQLVGIVNAKIVVSTVDNIGYAIPSNIVLYVAQNIIDNCENTELEHVQRCTLGMTITGYEPKAVYDSATGLTRCVETVTVEEVNAGSLAEGKFQTGDVIKKIESGDKALVVERVYQAVDFCLRMRSGDSATYTVERDGETIEVTVTFTAASAVDVA